VRWIAKRTALAESKRDLYREPSGRHRLGRYLAQGVTSTSLPAHRQTGVARADSHLPGVLCGARGAGY